MCPSIDIEMIRTPNLDDKHEDEVRDKHKHDHGHGHSECLFDPKLFNDFREYCDLQFEEFLAIEDA